MATPPFHYQHMFPLGPDKTEYYLLTKDYVSVSEFEGKPILKIEKEGLTAMANAAFRDVSFLLRRSHNEQVAKILSDPEASDNDKYVALTFLRNAEVSAKGKLPLCQDTGTAIIHGEKGQQVWTGYCDEEALSLGVYKTYTEENLRYSQNAPLTMYDEVNTKCNLPAQIDLEATEGMEYKFLCVTKGGGSANKTYLYQETKAVLNPATLVPFLVEKMKTLGTAACPPYHIAFVIGGTSAEKNLLTVKLASTHYYDELPTTGNEYGRAFRDVELEKQVLEEAYKIGLGAQFGGKYMAHDVRIIRLPRHGASCPIGLGVSCSADRNIKCKINKDGIWIEKMDDKPGELIPAELRSNIIHDTKSEFLFLSIVIYSYDLSRCCVLGTKSVTSGEDLNAVKFAVLKCSNNIKIQRLALSSWLFCSVKNCDLFYCLRNSIDQSLCAEWSVKTNFYNTNFSAGCH